VLFRSERRFIVGERLMHTIGGSTTILGRAKRS
jgi:hypothetical protein